VEDALFPDLFIGITKMHFNNSKIKKKENEYMDAIKILGEERDRCVASLCDEEVLSFSRRLKKIVNKVTEFLVERKMTTSESTVLLTAANLALNELGGLDLDPETEYFKFLKEREKDIISASEELEGFEEIADKALESVQDLILLLQEEGYFK
jgi:hypothetical protein